MSDLDLWLETARTTWQRWRIQLARLSPGPGVTSDQLASEDALTRWRAVRSLMRRPQPDLLSSLLALADDPDVMVRDEVANVLASWGPENVSEPVRRMLANPLSPTSATTMLTILVRLPDPANRSAIQKWLEHESATTRAAAFMALTALCDDSDLPNLESALAEEDIQVQRAIMSVLCAPEAGSLAQKNLTSSDPILRQRAAQAQPRIQHNLEYKRQRIKREMRKQSNVTSAAPGAAIDAEDELPPED